jgi:hypothetical protein
VGEAALINSNKELSYKRDQLLEKAKAAEALWNSQEALSNYQLAAKLSNDLGEFETARQILARITELKRRLHLLKRKSLEHKKIRIDEYRLRELEEEAKNALEIAVIAEEEQRWFDAIKYYQIVVQKNYEMDDTERAQAFETKIEKLKNLL